MEVYDIPIKTPEDAKRYFKAMGCSGFHMCRECPVRYEEFRRLNIAKDQQRQWAEESVSAALAELRSGTLEREHLWSVHSRMTDIVKGWELTPFLEEVYEVTCVIGSMMPQRDRLLVAETIVGRQELRYRPGYIFQSLDAGNAALARKFAAQARRLVDQPFPKENPEPLYPGEDLEERRQCLLATLAATEQACGIA
jgi:CheY-like chemotaxis protein